MAINSIVLSDSITVFGPPEVIEVGLEIGATGERGSYIYTGSVDPNTNPVLFESNPQKIGDLYLRTSNNNLYQYSSLPGGDQWQIITNLNVSEKVTITEQTSSYTLQLLDQETMIKMNSSSANTLTVPSNSSVQFDVGTRIEILQSGTGQTTISGSEGVTIYATPSSNLRTQWSIGYLTKIATNDWVLAGDLE